MRFLTWARSSWTTPSRSWWKETSSHFKASSSFSFRLKKKDGSLTLSAICMTVSQSPRPWFSATASVRSNGCPRKWLRITSQFPRCMEGWSRRRGTKSWTNLDKETQEFWLPLIYGAEAWMCSRYLWSSTTIFQQIDSYISIVSGVVEGSAAKVSPLTSSRTKTWRFWRISNNITQPRLTKCRWMLPSLSDSRPFISNPIL